MLLRLYSFLALLIFGLIVTQVVSAQLPFDSSTEKKLTVTNKEVATSSAEIPDLPPPKNPINITVSPISLILETDPGVPVTSQVRVRNNGTEAESLQLTVGTFTADETGLKPKLRDPRPEDTFLPWLKPDKTKVIVNPGEWETIPVVFSPPDDATLSYYYTIVFSRTKSAVVAPGETAVEGAPALLVLTTVRSPNAVRQLTLPELSLKSSIVEYLPQEFYVKIKNEGNVHIIPTGNIFIDSQNKKDLAILSINPNNGAVLPQTERIYTVKWDDGFPVFTTDPKIPENEQKPKAVWDFSKADRFRIGKYTAHVLLVYDDGRRDIPIESQITFWVLPWKIISVALVVVLLLGFGIRSIIISVIKKFSKHEEAHN